MNSLSTTKYKFHEKSEKRLITLLICPKMIEILPIFANNCVFKHRSVFAKSLFKKYQLFWKVCQHCIFTEFITFSSKNNVFSKFDLFVQFERKHIAMVDFNQECVCCFNHFRAVLAATFIIMTHSWVDFRVVQWHLHVPQLIQSGPQTCSKNSDIWNEFSSVI